MERRIPCRVCGRWTDALGGLCERCGGAETSIRLPADTTVAEGIAAWSRLLDWLER